MDIRPVSIDQVVAGRDGREYLVTGEAGRIASRLAELDPPLKVNFNEGGDYFAIYQTVKEGPVEVDKLVGRVPMDNWDDRVVKDFEMRAWELRNGINPIDRIEREEDAARAASDRELEEQIGEAAYPLMRAFQRELIGTNPRVFVPGGRR